MKNRDVAKDRAIFLISFGILGVFLINVIKNFLEISTSLIVVDMAFGFIIIIGVVIFFARINKLRNEKNLKEKGQVVRAKLVRCEEKNWKTNSGEGYLLEFEGDYAGEMHTFTRKGSFWINPQIIVEEKNIDTFDVFVNPKNSKKYLVDISSITNNIIDLTRFS